LVLRLRLRLHDELQHPAVQLDLAALIQIYCMINNGDNLRKGVHSSSSRDPYVYVPRAVLLPPAA